ncbi:hypothetical protein Clacol_009574 [Clathrus columnatus]|uniref:Peptidase A1 domain-containing protein n=1 Tax=Clathrus columnatus TaxID=1419009 RepID=A0AAV5ARI7_9AGAM|nr:hypothetical protein Clacol_009574 [Clathrus columnatus]
MYAVGSVQGPVAFVDTTFSGITVPKQAFILAEGSSATTTGITVGDGLIGLGPSAGSNVRSAVGNPSGDPFLDNVFRQNTSTPNFVTVLLQRVGDDEPTINGQFTISEIVPGMENIQSQPQVPVTVVTNQETPNQHWSTLIDAVYGPDGHLVPITSTVPGTPSGKFVVAYDTGFTFPQVPRQLSDAIYGRVQGAEYDQQDGFWIIPCEQELNVTFTIGGNNFTINPLDTSVPSSAVGGKDPNQCIGAFQPLDFDSGNTIDGIMGMAFIRNVYMLINFGDFVDGNPSNQKDPYMQFISTTTASTAHKDFVDSRLNGNDITSESQFALLPASQGQTSSAPKETGVPDSSNPFNSQNIHRFLPYIIAGSVIVGLALLGFLFACCCRRRRSRGIQFTNARSYRALQDPSPPGYNLYSMPPSSQQQGYGAYADPYYRG